VAKITAGKDDLNKQKDKKNQELQGFRQEVAKAEAEYRKEMDGGAGGRGRGEGEVARAKKALLEKNTAVLEENNARLLPEINELQARIKAKELEVEEADKAYKKAEVDSVTQGQRLNGLIKRIEIAHDISPKATLFLTLMLIFIEISPLFFKMMLTLSTIDYLTENQKRLARVRRGIAVGHVVDADGEAIMDVKNAQYHEAELAATRSIGKLEIDRQLTAQVQEEFTRIVSDDIRKNPGGYIDRLPPATPPATT